MANFTESDIRKLNRHDIKETICIAKNTMYSLSKDEFEWCMRVGTEKIFEKEKHGMRNYFYSKTKMSFQEKEALSIAGELVFSRLLGLPDFDESEAINNSWCDLVINGEPIDVKTTPNKLPYLNMNKAKADGKCADIIVSIHQINMFTYCFLGCIKLVNIKKQEYLVDSLYPYYRVPITELENYEISHVNQEIPRENETDANAIG